MTPQQIAVAKALGRATLPVASNAKRFARQMAYAAEHMPDVGITEKQDAYLRALAYRFRRQIPAGLLDEPGDVKKPYSVLQWLGPEMARHGLLKNDEWVIAHTDEACAMFRNQAMKVAACYLAGMHPRAIDYIQQAPVIVLAMMDGQKFDREKIRQYQAERIKPLIEYGAKLKKIFEFYKLPMQLRALSPNALSPTRWEALRHLHLVPPSTLAQAIPDSVAAQEHWMRAIGYWADRMSQRVGDRTRHIVWAAQHLGALENAHQAADLADFASSPVSRFNIKWTLDEAVRANDRWHAELARQTNEQRFYSRHGMAWDQPISYGSLPVSFGIHGFDIVAIQSGEQLYAEGRAMRHCVASYVPDVIAGGSRIFGIRRGEQRVATLELRRLDTRWQINQLKGPCNVDPANSVWIAAKDFLRHIQDNSEMGKPL